MCALYGRGAEPDDLRSEAWLACLEADNSYCKCAGCCAYDEYLFLYVRESLRRVRVQRNRRFAVQSRLSFEDGQDEGAGAVTNWLPKSCQGDMWGVETCVELADFLEQLLPEEWTVLKRMMEDDSSGKISTEMKIPFEAVEEVRRSIQKKGRAYFMEEKEQMIA